MEQKKLQLLCAASTSVSDGVEEHRPCYFSPFNCMLPYVDQLSENNSLCVNQILSLKDIRDCVSLYQLTSRLQDESQKLYSTTAHNIQ